ncbi:MAG: SufB/SufD family protein [Candidatus Hodarchaeales archaeon]
MNKQVERNIIEEYKTDASEHAQIDSLEELPQTDQSILEDTGTEIKNTNQTRSGSFLQMDQSVVNIQLANDLIEILSISDALTKYSWLREKYFWKAVPADKDEITAAVNEFPAQGYFIRALPGYKGDDKPVQACLYLTEENLVQRVHNIVIVEEGAELSILSGCASSHSAKRGAHLGISEFYVKKGGWLSYTMVHSWSEGIEVKPRSAAIIEEDGAFISNYVSLKPVRSLQTYPVAKINGKNGIARFYSVVATYPGNIIDLGSATELNAEGAATEIISRVVSHGGKIISRGRITSRANGTTGHLECQGLLLDDNGSIIAIPELEGYVSDSELSHEAAVGRIAEEKIDYLRARGLTVEEATAAIVTGFMNVDMKSVPEALKKKMKAAVDSYGKSMF